MRFRFPLGGRELPSLTFRGGWGGSHDHGGSSRWLHCGLAVSDDEGDVTGPAARTAELGRLEAVLFIAREPLASRKLAQLAGVADGTKARTLVRTLNRLYDSVGTAFRIEEVAGGFQLMTRAQFAPWLRRLQAGPSEVRLSVPAMETLAVVAYRQPILRADVEAIRAVQCGEILRQLIERDLVRIVGRSEELGRPFLYGTSKRFLQVVGLRSLDDLPQAEMLHVAPQRRPAECTDPNLVMGGEDCADNKVLDEPIDPREMGKQMNAEMPATTLVTEEESIEMDATLNAEVALGEEELDSDLSDDEGELDDDLDDEEYEEEYEYEDDEADEYLDEDDDGFEEGEWEEVVDDDEGEWDDEDEDGEWEYEDDEEYEYEDGEEE